MKLLMAEDLLPVREHLSELLDETGGVQVRFLWQEAKPLLLEVAVWRPAVVIVDMSMRGSMAVGVLDSIKKNWPETAVVISATVYLPYYRQAFLSLGADMFFDKSLEWDQLIAFLKARRNSIARSASTSLEAERKASV